MAVAHLLWNSIVDPVETGSENVLLSREGDYGISQLTGLYDTPSYARRALRLQEAQDRIMALCRMQSAEWLTGVATRLRAFNTAQQNAAAAYRTGKEMADPVVIAQLTYRLTANNPYLPNWAKPPAFQTALTQLRESIDRYNRRWKVFLQGIDLAPVNSLIDGFNRYYLVEKECSFRSFRLAARGYQPQEHWTAAKLLAQFPLLPTP